MVRKLKNPLFFSRGNSSSFFRFLLACSGDSGGPLVCESTQDRGVSKLFGVTSFGFSCAQPYYVGVYSRVQSVRSWIERNTGI